MFSRTNMLCSVRVWQSATLSLCLSKSISICFLKDSVSLRSFPEFWQSLDVWSVCWVKYLPRYKVVPVVFLLFSISLIFKWPLMLVVSKMEHISLMPIPTKVQILLFLPAIISRQRVQIFSLKTVTLVLLAQISIIAKAPLRIQCFLIFSSFFVSHHVSR